MVLMKRGGADIVPARLLNNGFRCFAAKKEKKEKKGTNAAREWNAQRGG